jgi:hypothetical protein
MWVSVRNLCLSGEIDRAKQRFALQPIAEVKPEILYPFSFFNNFKNAVKLFLDPLNKLFTSITTIRPDFLTLSTIENKVIKTWRAA